MQWLALEKWVRNKNEHKPPTKLRKQKRQGCPQPQ